MQLKPLRWLRFAVLVLAADILFYTSILCLLLIYGGHRRAYIFDRNTHCTLNVTRAPSSLSDAPVVLLHLTDLHVTAHNGKARRHLTQLLDSSLPYWTGVASAAVVSGDLVNAIEKRSYPLGTRSVHRDAEWAWLADYARRFNALVPWHVTHGNHDTFGGFPGLFNQVKPAHLYNLTTLRSSPSSPRVKLARIASANISLVGLDLTQPHPIHRPLNFFGDASSLPPLPLGRNADNAVLFAHYPSSTLKRGASIHAALARASTSGHPAAAAYLSGHLHTLHGVAPDGLSAVSRVSGALELQAPDVVSTAAYRVLAFDAGGALSFRTFHIARDVGRNHSLSSSILVLNLPRAGLCSPGAGAAAASSTNARVLSVHVDLAAAGVRARVDTKQLGTFKRVPCDDPVCKHVYTVKWDATLFASGVHVLTLYDDVSNDTFDYPFSIDGSSAHHATRLLHATFALSDFDSVARYLSVIPLVLCLVSLVVAHRSSTHRHSPPSVALFAFAAAALTGAPLLVAPRLSAHDEGWGAVSLYSMFIPTGLREASVDAPFLFSLRVLWPGVIPCALLELLDAYNFQYTAPSVIIAATALYRVQAWTTDIAGAHGFRSALVSPGCVPLLLICLYYFADRTARFLDSKVQEKKVQ